MRYLHEIALRLLDYNGTPVASISQIPSITREVYDSVCSALGTVYAKAPGIFQRSHEGGVLREALTGTVSGTNTAAFSSAEFCRNSLCTLRITGSETDHTVTNYASSGGLYYGNLSPGYTGVAAGAVASDVAATSYHDAFIVPSSRRVVGNVSIDNKPLIRVADRDQARKEMGCLAQQYTTGAPLYWWDGIVCPRTTTIGETIVTTTVTTNEAGDTISTAMDSTGIATGMLVISADFPSGTTVTAITTPGATALLFFSEGKTTGGSTVGVQFALPGTSPTAAAVICFYPMPEVLTGFTYESLWEPASLTDLTTLFSDASPVSLGLSFDVAREILLPLAVKEYTAKATFSNQRLVPAIDSAFQRATRTLMDMGPKDGKTKNW